MRSWFPSSSSRSDLMSSDVLARLPQVRRSYPSILVFPESHVPSRSPHAPCPLNKYVSSKQVEETWTSNTSPPQPSLSQVNTIGCADEGLWIVSLEDSKKRRYTVNWEDQSCCNQTEEHELMIDSEFYKRRSRGSEQRGTATLRTKSGVRTRDDEQWKTNLDPDHI